MKYVDYEAVTDRADEAANATATWDARDLRVMILADTDSPNLLAAVPQLGVSSEGGVVQAPTPFVQGTVWRTASINPSAAANVTAVDMILPGAATRIMGVIKQNVLTEADKQMPGDMLAGITKAAAGLSGDAKTGATLAPDDFEQAQPLPQPLRWGGAEAVGLADSIDACAEMLRKAKADASKALPAGDADLDAFRARPSIGEGGTQEGANAARLAQHHRDVDAANVRVVAAQERLGSLRGQAKGGALQTTMDLSDFRLSDFMEDGRCSLWGELVEFLGHCAKASDRGEGSHFALQVRTLVEAAAALADTPVEQFLGDKALASAAIASMWRARRPPQFLAQVPHDAAQSRIRLRQRLKVGGMPIEAFTADPRAAIGSAPFLRSLFAGAMCDKAALLEQQRGTNRHPEGGGEMSKAERDEVDVSACNLRREAWLRGASAAELIEVLPQLALGLLGKELSIAVIGELEAKLQTSHGEALGSIASAKMGWQARLKRVHESAEATKRLQQGGAGAPAKEVGFGAGVSGVPNAFKTQWIAARENGSGYASIVQSIKDIFADTSIPRHEMGARLLEAMVTPYIPGPERTALPPMAVFLQMASGALDADACDSELGFLKQRITGAWPQLLGKIARDFVATSAEHRTAMTGFTLPRLDAQRKQQATKGDELNFVDAHQCAVWARHGDWQMMQPDEITLEASYEPDLFLKLLRDKDFVNFVLDYWSAQGAVGEDDDRNPDSLLSQFETLRRLDKEYGKTGEEALLAMASTALQAHYKYLGHKCSIVYSSKNPGMSMPEPGCDPIYIAHFADAEVALAEAQKLVKKQRLGDRFGLSAPMGLASSAGAGPSGAAGGKPAKGLAKP